MLSFLYFFPYTTCFEFFFFFWISSFYSTLRLFHDFSHVLQTLSFSRFLMYWRLFNFSRLPPLLSLSAKNSHVLKTLRLSENFAVLETLIFSDNFPCTRNFEFKLKYLCSRVSVSAKKFAFYYKLWVLSKHFLVYRTLWINETFSRTLKTLTFWNCPVPHKKK